MNETSFKNLFEHKEVLYERGMIFMQTEATVKLICASAPAIEIYSGKAKWLTNTGAIWFN